MLKCKISDEASCGKDCCCYDCAESNKCKDVCDAYLEYGKDVLTKCDDLEEVDTEMVTLDSQIPEVITAIADLVTQKKAIEEQEKKMRVKLQEAMEQFGVKSFENEVVKFTYVAPTQRKSIDSAKLKKEHPEIAEAYQKVSQVKASVKIEIK